MSIIGFEGYAIATKQYPWQAACFLGQKIGLGTQEILTDFPMRALGYMNYFMSRKINIDKEDLSNYLDCPSTKHTIKMLCDKDRGINYSEMGGVAVLVERNGSNYLSLIEIEGENLKFCRQIIENRDNKEYLKQLIGKNGERFEKVYSDKILSENEWQQIQDATIKDSSLDKIIAKYMMGSDYMYELTQDQRIQLFYPGVMPGKIVGMFHVHDCGEVPSKPDLEGSRDIREFVIANHNTGFTLYELVDGIIRSEIRKQF